MAIDRAKFYVGIRQGPFPGSLSAEAVRGVTAILDEWERRGLTDLRWLAYMLATVLAECGRNMLPVREGFKATDVQARAYVAGKHYKYAKVEGGNVYYGRGLVQLTWLDNYRKMAAITGVDLVSKPDLALEPAIAAKIMFEGMIRGTFTGKKLADYFGAGLPDWKNARRIINALDRADEIAGYAKQFHADLVAADTATATAPTPLPVPTTAPTTKQDAKEAGGIAGAVAAVTGGFYALWGNWAFKLALFLVIGAALYWFIARPIIRRMFALDEVEADFLTRLRLALKGIKTSIWSWFLGIAGVALPVLSYANDVDLSAFLPDIMGVPASVYQYAILAVIGWITKILRRASNTPDGQTDMALATVQAPPLVPDIPKVDPSTEDLVEIINAKRKPKPVKKAKRKKRAKVKA